MPVDASIYQMMPEHYVYQPSRGLESLIGLQRQRKQDEMAQQKLDQENAIKGAYSFSENPETGEVEFNRQETLKNLTGLGPAGSKVAFEEQQKWKAQDAEAEKKRITGQLDKHKLVSRTLMGVTDQKSYEQALNMLGPVASDLNLPKAYDPNYIRNVGLRELSAFERLKLEQDNKPKPPPGYQFLADGSLQAIPGGPAFQKQQEKVKQTELRKKTKERAAKTVVQDIGRALKIVEDGSNWIGPGWAAAGSLVPGSSANVLDDHIKSIRSNISVDQLQAMRESSRTGGALGNVTERQQEKLEGLLGNLSNSQDLNVLRDNLKRVSNEYNMIIHGEEGIEKGIWKPFELSFDEQGVAKESKGSNGSMFNNNAYASPGGRPKRIMQNGVVYELNPETGEYE